MADSPRLEELRRRVQADPASIAFAALAEEYRRAGKFREAVDASRAGLRYHPTYVSARVTLGRSLMELQEVEQAERELSFVLKSAPDNLAARRALGELCWQQLRFADALGHFRTAQTLAPADAELPNILQSLERELAADRASHSANGKAPEPEAKTVEPEPKATQAELKAKEPEPQPQSQPEPAKEAPAPAAAVVASPAEPEPPTAPAAVAEAVAISPEALVAAAPAQPEPQAEPARVAAEAVSPNAESHAAAAAAEPESSLAPADALAEAVTLSAQLESSAEPALASAEAVARIEETPAVAAPPEPAADAAGAIVVVEEHAASEAFVVSEDEVDAVSFVDDSFESHDEPPATVSSEPAADIAYAADAAEAVGSDAAFVADDIDTFSHAPAEPEHAPEPEPAPALASAAAPEPVAPVSAPTPAATTADDRVLSLLEQFHRALVDEQRDRLAAATPTQTSASASPDTPPASRETEHAKTFVPTETETARSA